MFVCATQRHLTEEFAQDSGALSSQVSSWESRALLLAAPGAQVIHEDPYDRSLHSLGASKQCDGCQLRGEVRENKTMPYVPPGVCTQSYFVLKQEQILGIALLPTLLRTCSLWGCALR